jgi:hypothetical protein
MGKEKEDVPKEAMSQYSEVRIPVSPVKRTAGKMIAAVFQISDHFEWSDLNPSQYLEH